MRVVFSTLFKKDLSIVETQYRAISSRQGEGFYTSVEETIRTIVKRKGGDHAGPQGFSCRRCQPFPYFVYYKITQDTLYVIGLVHERRHPDYLRKNLGP